MLKCVIFLIVMIFVVSSLGYSQDQSNQVIEVIDESSFVDGLVVNGPNVLWRSRIGKEVSEGFSAPLFVSNENVLVFLDGVKDSIDSGYICSIDSMSGELGWVRNIGGVKEVPLIQNGIMYVGSQSGDFSALSIDTGDVKWVLKTDNWATEGARTIAAGSEKYVVFGYDDGYIYIVSKETGEVVIKHKVDGTLYATPMIDHANLYFVTSAGTVVALSLDTGELIWTKSIGEDIFFLNMVLENDTLAFFWCKNKGKLRQERSEVYVSAIKTVSGDFLWQKTIDSDKPISWPIKAFGNIYYIVGNKIAALSFESGATVWEFSSDFSIAPFLSIVDQSLFAGNGNSQWKPQDGDNSFYVLDCISGELDWQANIGGGLKTLFSVMSEAIVLNTYKEGKEHVLFLSADDGLPMGDILIRQNEHLYNSLAVKAGIYYIATKDEGGDSFIYKVEL